MGEIDHYVVRASVTVPEGAPQSPATVIVQVEDVSRADAPSTVVAEHRRNGLRLAPGEELSFEVDVPASRIDPRHHYALRVHIEASGTGEVKVGDMVTTQSYPVLTWGHGSDVRATLKKV